MTGPASAQRAIDEHRGEPEERDVEARQEAGVIEDQGGQHRVIDLVRNRAPEGQRAPAIKQRMRPEERSVEEIEVLGHGLAEGWGPSVSNQWENRQEGEP